MADHGTLEPSLWIARFAPLVQPGSSVLDLASGRGRHARLFAARAARVLAVDRDAAALAALDGVAGVETLCADLEGHAWPLAGQCFDAIVVTHYLYRPRFDALLDCLAPDGLLLYETFARGNERYGSPSNPAFLLEPGELLARCAGRLTVVAFEQGQVERDGRRAVLQAIAATGPARAWPVSLGRENRPR